MKKPLISMIVAICSRNNVIGREDGKLPWHIAEDLKNFRRITMGHPIIMGRKTWETFNGIPLANRVNIIISNKSFAVPTDVVLTNSIESAIQFAKSIEKEEIFIIGGAQIYEQSLDLTDRLYITLIDGDFEGSVKFPECWNLFFKKKIHESELKHPVHKITFNIFEK